MSMLCRLRAAAGVFPRFRLRRDLQRFLSATEHCQQAQHATLQRLLALNEGSVFSTERGLSGNLSPEQFRQKMPVSDYETYRSYIDKMRDGDHRALLGANNPLLMFTLSSGTTRESKFIPITQQFLRDYRRGWQNWGISTVDDYPAVHTMHILQISSNHDRFRTAGGTPCGNISGLAASMQKRLVQTMYTVPSTVATIETPEAKQYTALRLSLADENVGMVITANPSTLIHLAKLAEEHLEELVRDIADGTLSKRYEVSSSIRAALGRRIGRKNRQRARQLEQIREQTGHCYPKDYWPRLQVVGVWTGGSAGAYLHPLREFYGDVPVRDHGLSASEGRMTIPMSGDSSQGILDIASHYFEFIPEEEYGNDSPTILEAHELQEGENYYILLTTPSGFCRYDICDVVRCNGFYNTTPMLEFLNKGSHMSNITGEKISESQVVMAVREALAEQPIHLKHFTVAPVWGDVPRYQLLAEGRDFPSSEIADRFVQIVDQALQRLNCEYDEKRNTGRLATMSVVALPDDTWSEFTRYRQAGLGGSLEQYKHPCLVPDLEFVEKLLSGKFRDNK